MQIWYHINIEKPRPLLAIVTRAENPSRNQPNQGKSIIPGRALHDKAATGPPGRSPSRGGAAQEGKKIGRT
mgnify:CR=1 FL=1